MRFFPSRSSIAAPVFGVLAFLTEQCKADDNDNLVGYSIVGGILGGLVLAACLKAYCTGPRAPCGCLGEEQVPTTSIV